MLFYLILLLLPIHHTGCFELGPFFMVYFLVSIRPNKNISAFQVTSLTNLCRVDIHFFKLFFCISNCMKLYFFPGSLKNIFMFHQ